MQSKVHFFSMSDFFSKEQTHQIYRLCQLGYANEVTIARLANAGEEYVLKKYIDEARRRKDVAMFHEEMKLHRERTNKTVAKWVKECLQADDPKAEALNLKPILEALGWIEPFRDAWKEQIKSQ